MSFLLGPLGLFSGVNLLLVSRECNHSLNVWRLLSFLKMETWCHPTAWKNQLMLLAPVGFFGSENQSRKCQVTESCAPTHPGKKIQRSTLQCGDSNMFWFSRRFLGKWSNLTNMCFFKMGGEITTSIAISGPGNSWTCPKGCVQTGPGFRGGGIIWFLGHPVIPPEVSWGLVF